MEFKDIISISGIPGLFQLISSKNNGIIVKSLEDEKTQFISSRIHGVSSLENISVYTQNDETTELANVLREMQKNEANVPLPDLKAEPKELKEYFKKIIPLMDEEKVHVSDMKKMVRWYSTLKRLDLIPAEPTPAETEKTESGGEEDESGNPKEESKEK